MWKIYKFTNKTYNEKEKCYKSYIGMTLKTIEERFAQHCSRDDCKAFHAAIKKYGEDNWIFETLEYNIKSEQEALIKETLYIETHNTLVRNRKGYNIRRSSNPRPIVNGQLKCFGECESWKPVEKFNKNKNMECGRNAWCKDCRKKYNAQSLEHDRLRNQKYREDNPEWIAQVRLNYKEIKKEKDKISSKNISAENVLLSIEELYQRTPTKYCFGGCDTIKPTTEFVRRDCVKDGFYSWCKDCVRRKNKESRNRNENIGG